MTTPFYESADGTVKQRRKYGSGGITAKGYVRKNRVMMHRIVWEKHNGPIPDGFEIHHIDEDKENNDISNLELVDTLTHKRIHSGCKLIDGEWWKPCRKCGEMKKVSTDYYERKDGISSRCKQCSIEGAVRDKQRRRMEAARA
jgi:hypothetical protein